MDSMQDQIKKSVFIDSSLTTVWHHLITPALMIQWMAESEMELEINTDWIISRPITIKGFLHARFENKGSILQLDPQKTFQYSHLSSLSELPDNIENYSIITFLLTQEGDGTLLTVTVENFPTESIYKHLDLYWGGTLSILKKMIEQLGIP